MVGMKVVVVHRNEMAVVEVVAVVMVEMRMFLLHFAVLPRRVEAIFLFLLLSLNPVFHLYLSFSRPNVSSFSSCRGVAVAAAACRNLLLDPYRVIFNYSVYSYMLCF